MTPPHRRPTHLLLAAAIALLAFAPSAAAQMPDPLAAGPHPVKREANYEAGSIRLQNPGSPNQASNGQREEFTQYLRGDLHYPDPASDPGPWPVIVHVHGNHAACRTTGVPLGTGESTLFHDCTESYSSATNTFTPVPGREPLPNDEGYHYMAENLASHGYLVISVDQDEMMAHQPGDDRGMYSRSQIISAHLDALARTDAGTPAGNLPAELAGKLDLTSIGLMGHSRGGDGVTHFIDYNRTRPAPGRRYPLKAVVSLAPVDYERRAPQDVAYATILPMCDGDVSNIQGARFFERSQYADPGDPFPRIQWALHGTNHNFYNSNWINDDAGSYSTSATGRDLACGATVPGNVRLTRPDQEKTGIALMNSFFRRYVGDETEFEPLMTGEAGLPASACKTDGSPGVACQEELLTSYFAEADERLDVLRPENDTPLTTNALGGRISGSGFSNPYRDAAGTAPATGFDPPPDTEGGYDWCNPEPKHFQGETPRPTAVKPCPLPALTAPGGQQNEREQAPVNRSYGNQLALAWDGEATLSTVVPARYGDVSGHRLIALGAAVNYFDTRNPQRAQSDGSAVDPAARTQDFEVVLVDAAGNEAAVPAGSPEYGNALHPSLGASPVDGFPNARGRRHILLNEVRIPLEDFEGVDLTKVRRIEFRFGKLTPTGSVQLADVRFQEDGTPQTFPPVPLAGFASKAPPTDEPVGTTHLAAPGVVPSECSDSGAPTSRFVAIRGRAVSGTATDSGCAGLRRVQASVALKVAGGKCRYLTGSGKLTRPTSCRKPRFLTASGTSTWRLGARSKLPRGRYVVTTRAVDLAGNIERGAARLARVG